MESKLNRSVLTVSSEQQVWLKLMDQLAAMVGLTLVAYDSYRNLVGISRANPICQAIQEREQGFRLCERDCGGMLAEAAKGGSIRTFKCHAGLYNFAAPILRNGNVQWVLLGGRVFQNYQDFAHFTQQASQYSLQDYVFVDWENALKFESAGYFEQTVRLLQSIVDLSSNASSAEEKVKRKTSLLETLYDLSNVLSLEASIERASQLILEALGVLFDVREAVMLGAGPGSDLYRPTGTLGSSLTSKFELNAKIHAISESLSQGKPHFLNETYQILKMGYPESVRSIHSFPILSQQTVGWILQVVNASLDEESIQVLSTFCRHMGVSFENLRLRQEVRDQSAVLSVVDEFSSFVTVNSASKDLYLTLLHKITEILKAEQGSLWLHDETSNDLAVKSVKGINEKIVERLRIKPGEGISGTVFETGRSLLVKDIGKEKRFQAHQRARYKTSSFISAPLKLNQQKIGVINVADRTDGESFDQRDLRLLETLAGHATAALERAEFHQKSEDLMKISITDSLTDLYNRRFFQDRLTEEIERAKRHGHALSFIMMDIDNFKSYNDTYGHLAGDEALRMTATLIKGSVRNIDIVARYGGEEFAVILPVTEIAATKEIAERIRSSVASQYYPDESMRLVVKVTVSLGIASFPKDAESLVELVGNADKALYLAKVSGKNRVAVFDQAKRMSSASGI